MGTLCKVWNKTKEHRPEYCFFMGKKQGSGINPYKCVQRAEINEKELQRISLKESYLNIITPYLEKIHRAISGEGYLLYYADELGNVLHCGR